jgi:hypothetical protein
MVAAAVTAGCYNYDPLITASPEPGTYLSLSLTDAGSQELARSLGPNVFIVRGRYLQHGDRGLLVSVTSVELKVGNEVSWAGETVALPDSAISAIEVRQLAKGRSALLLGAGVAGLVATTAAFSYVGGGTRPGKQGPPAVKQ